MTNDEQFVRDYVRTALWSTGDGHGVPLDRDHCLADVAQSTLAAARQDCAAFLALVESDPETKWANNSRLAHDFWLCRCRHGAGFRDGHHSERVGDALTRLAQTFAEVDLYVGDDGQIHGC